MLGAFDRITMYARDDAFRCVEFIVRDCCWQCATFSLRFVFPARNGKLDIDTFLAFCRANQPDYGRPKTEESAMHYADSFEMIESKPAIEFISKRAAMIRGDA